jgi:hypothetical protein
MRKIIVASLLALGTGGCGLISSDVTETPFDLPPKTYSFDSSMFNVPSALSQEVPCGVAPVVDCCNPTPPLPAPDCTANTITCEPNAGGTSVCTAQVTVQQGSMTNLAQEAPKLAGLTGYLNIKIKRISYQVSMNTLSVNLPDVELFMAPSTSDPNPMKFGTMPAIPAGMTTAGDIVLEPNAGQVFATYTQDISVPFAFIAKTTLKVSTAPTGRIDMTISGRLAASL